jgi:hypothetical protein
MKLTREKVTTCPDCRSEIVPVRIRTPTRGVRCPRLATMVLPEGYAIPTCSGCGREWMSHDEAKEALLVSDKTKTIQRRRSVPSDTQSIILKFIHSSLQIHGYPPTIREICIQSGISSTNGVNGHLLALERMGLLTRGDLKARTLIPTNDGLKFIAERNRSVKTKRISSNEDKDVNPDEIRAASILGKALIEAAEGKIENVIRVLVRMGSPMVLMEQALSFVCSDCGLIACVCDLEAEPNGEA